MRAIIATSPDRRRGRARVPDGSGAACQHPPRPPLDLVRRQPDTPVCQDAINERLLRAYFVDGLDIGDRDRLADCAAEVGFDRDAVETFLESNRGLDEVRRLLDTAIPRGVTAVPTYVVGGGWAIPGAQEPDTFAMIIRKMAEKSVAPGGDAG